MIQSTISNGIISSLLSSIINSKEIGAYLAAEGNFTSTHVVEDVHLRVRVPDATKPNRLRPPTSAVSVCDDQTAYL